MNHLSLVVLGLLVWISLSAASPTPSKEGAGDDNDIGDDMSKNVEPDDWDKCFQAIENFAGVSTVVGKAWRKLKTWFNLYALSLICIFQNDTASDDDRKILCSAECLQFINDEDPEVSS